MSNRNTEAAMLIVSLIALAGLALIARELWVYAGVGQ